MKRTLRTLPFFLSTLPSLILALAVSSAFLGILSEPVYAAPTSKRHRKTTKGKSITSRKPATAQPPTKNVTGRVMLQSLNDPTESYKYAERRKEQRDSPIEAAKMLMDFLQEKAINRQVQSSLEKLEPYIEKELRSEKQNNGALVNVLIYQNVSTEQKFFSTSYIVEYGQNALDAANKGYLKPMLLPQTSLELVDMGDSYWVWYEIKNSKLLASQVNPITRQAFLSGLRTERARATAESASAQTERAIKETEARNRAAQTERAAQAERAAKEAEAHSRAAQATVKQAEMALKETEAHSRAAQAERAARNAEARRAAAEAATAQAEKAARNAEARRATAEASTAQAEKAAKQEAEAKASTSVQSKQAVQEAEHRKNDSRSFPNPNNRDFNGPGTSADRNSGSSREAAPERSNSGREASRERAPSREPAPSRERAPSREPVIFERIIRP